MVKHIHSEVDKILCRIPVDIGYLNINYSDRVCIETNSKTASKDSTIKYIEKILTAYELLKNEKIEIDKYLTSNNAAYEYAIFIGKNYKMIVKDCIDGYIMLISNINNVSHHYQYINFEYYICDGLSGVSNLIDMIISTKY